MDYFILMVIAFVAGVWTTNKQRQITVEIQPTVTKLEIRGDLPIPKLADLVGHVMSYNGTLTFQVEDTLYYLVQLTGAKGEPLAAFTTDAGVAWKIASTKKGKDIMLMLGDAGKLEIAQL